MRSKWSTIVSVLTMSILVGQPDLQPVFAAEHDAISSSIIGRWDIVVDGNFPSWLEIRKSGNSTLVGRYVGQFGSARPVAKIERLGDAFMFAVPPQWENRRDDQVFMGKLTGGELVGKTTDETGKELGWHAVRAPALQRKAPKKWDQPIELFNGRNLEGWKPLLDEVENGWVVKNGILINEKPGQNIATEREFEDFKLHAEFRYPEGSNSGIYLRGRYEAQIEDNFGDEPDSHKIGGIYGHLTPSSNAAKRHGEWQSYDIVLIGPQDHCSLEW